MTLGSATADARFKAELLLVIPHLRVFAYSMTKRQNADDLAQEAMLKAWKSRATYKPGTNLKAWTFTILRNLALSGKRRAWRTQPLDPAIAEAVLIANDDPYQSEELIDVRNAMQRLPVYLWETLILAGPAGLAHDEIAKNSGCAVGTVKSRVNRARAALTDILEERRSGRRARTALSSTRVFDRIMQDAENLRRRMEPAKPAPS